EMPRTEIQREELPFPTSEKESLTWKYGYCTLHDMFRRILIWPRLWDRTHRAGIWNDKDVLLRDKPDQDFQSPFCFTLAAVSESSMTRVRRQPDVTNKELASLLCKFTLDNRSIEKDFVEVNLDYLQRSL